MIIIWCSENAAKTLPPSAQHARTRLVNLTHTWCFLTSSQIGRKGRLDVFFFAYDRSLSLCLCFSIPFLWVWISYVDAKLFALNCVHVWKGWPRIDLVMLPFWQYFEYIYFSTFNIYIYYMLVYANYKRSCNMSNRFQAVYVWTLHFWGKFC